MSKKPAAGKKGAAPEPVPVVEEPPKPSPEELEAIRIAEEAKRIREHNIGRVQFPKLPIKHIVSYHSSTILASETPITINITDLKENEVRLAFRHQAGERGYVTTTQLPEILASLVHITPESMPSERYTRILQQYTAMIPRFLPKPLAAALATSVPSLPTHETPSTNEPVPSHPEPTATNNELQLTELDFLQFFLLFFTPSFYYGQHLRLYAGRNCNEEVVELCLRGCAVNTANGEGLTALHIACEHDHASMLDTLLSQHVQNHPLLHLQLNVQDKYGWTPLHCAVHHGSTACTLKLLTLLHKTQSGAGKGSRIDDFPGLQGVDVSLRTHDGKSALHFACMMNRGQLVGPLLAAGCALLEVDHDGRTPLHYAAAHGHLSLYNEHIATSNGAEAQEVEDCLRYRPQVYVDIDETPKVFV